jgi:DNA-directed RNA polymerase beta' subunit
VRRISNVCGYTLSATKNLVEPFFHIGFRSHIKKFLDCICLKCSRVLIHKNEAKIADILKTKNGIKRLAEVYNAVKNVTSCPKCGTTVSKIRLEDKKSSGSFLIVAETDLENIKDESIQLLGKKKLKLILTPEIVHEKLKNISDDENRKRKNRERWGGGRERSTSSFSRRASDTSAGTAPSSTMAI